MIDLKRIQEINKEIQETTKVGLGFFTREFEKFNEKLSDAVKKYNEEAVSIQKELIKEAQVLDDVTKKTKGIKKEYTIYKEKVGDLNKKSEENKEKEEELLKLHKVLVNKGKSLDAREKEIKEKERRLNDR